MKSKEGISKQKPLIKTIRFDQKGKMSVYLEDGRLVIVPLTFFPSIKKLSTSDRNDWHISNGQIIIFKNCDDVFHLEQILGTENQYSYSFN